MSETESERGKNVYWSWLADISFHCGWIVAVYRLKESALGTCQGEPIFSTA